MRVTEGPGPDSMGTLPVTIDAAFGNGRLPSFRGGHWHAHACARPASLRGKPRRGRAGPLTPSVGRTHWQKLKLERQGVGLGALGRLSAPAIARAVLY